MSFMNEMIHQAKLSTGPGDAVLAVQVNHEKNFAFLEVRIIPRGRLKTRRFIAHRLTDALRS